MNAPSVNAVIMAGSRPGGDPLAEVHDVPVKALIPVAGQPMLAHVMRNLLDCPIIDRAHILTQSPDVLVNDPDTRWITTDQRVTMAESRSTIAASLDGLLARDDAHYPMLITTADNVLINRPMIDHFLASASGADIAIGLVERDTLVASYPASKRTWLKLKGGAYSGANLFYFGSAKAREVLHYWAEVEQERKKGWKILTIFGPWLLFLAVTRMLSITQLASRVSKKFELNIRIVEMPQAEACIDVDKSEDLELVESILKDRAG